MRFYKWLKQIYKNISKQDIDLLLIGQTGIINYGQLQLTGLHGTTREAYRVAINKLKEKKLVETFFYRERNLAITLTSKGKEYLKELFGQEFIDTYCRQMGKPLPGKASPQFVHRMNTNTFYCCYLSAPGAILCKWYPEKAYENREPVYGQGMNRCDGFLSISEERNYFVEQDNQTQRIQAIYEKISNYITSGVFGSYEQKINNTLVFCVDVKLSTAKKDRINPKKKLHEYKLALKILKLWKVLEHIHAESFLFGQIINIMEREEDEVVTSCFISDKEKSELIVLFTENPSFLGMGFQEFSDMKDRLRQKTAESKEMKMELNTAFQLRYQDIYLSLLEYRGNDLLRNQLMEGLSIYVLPQHDISSYLPHLMVFDFHTKEVYVKCMQCMGLHIHENSVKFFEVLKIKEIRPGNIWFRHVFALPGVYVIWEDIGSDIGAYYRIYRFIKQSGGMVIETPLLFILLVNSRKEAISFFSQLEAELIKQEEKLLVSFMVKEQVLFQNLMQTPFSIWKCKEGMETKSIFVEADNGLLRKIWEDEE